MSSPTAAYLHFFIATFLHFITGADSIEWEEKGTHDKHLSVLDYKKEQRAKEVAALETVMAEKESQVEGQEQRLKELAPR